MNALRRILSVCPVHVRWTWTRPTDSFSYRFYSSHGRPHPLIFSLSFLFTLFQCVLYLVLRVLSFFLSLPFSHSLSRSFSSLLCLFLSRFRFLEWKKDNHSWIWVFEYLSYEKEDQNKIPYMYETNRQKLCVRMRLFALLRFVSTC